MFSSTYNAFIVEWFFILVVHLVFLSLEKVRSVHSLFLYLTSLAQQIDTLTYHYW